MKILNNRHRLDISGEHKDLNNSDSINQGGLLVRSFRNHCTNER